MANIVNLLGLLLVMAAGVSSLIAGSCWGALAAGAILTGTCYLMERG
jgi:hypothetical protein